VPVDKVESMAFAEQLETEDRFIKAAGSPHSKIDQALNERGRALSSPATHPKSCSNYFLTFAFLARAADP
jgi:hypothetical protein